PTAPYIPSHVRPPGAPMIRLILLCAFLLLVLLIAGPVIAAHFLPWWGSLLLVVAELAFLVFALPKLIKWGFKGVLMGIFKAKSAVLRRATVDVHAVRIVSAPTKAPAAVPVAKHDASDADDQDEET